MRTTLRRLQVLLPLALFLASLFLYSRTLAPTITWQHDGYDGGDLITAAYTGGIPHPTGYPTYMLLGRCFLLLPVGDIAHRMNLLSAVSAALAVMLLYSAATFLLQSRAYARLASVCAALFLATSRVFWSQALIAEVYALNCLFFTAALCLLLRFQAYPGQGSGDPRSRAGAFELAVLAALTYGLSLGNHLTMVLTAPLWLWTGASTVRRRTLTPRQWVCVLGSFILGLSVYVYLPLRAGRPPLLNWGDPSTLKGFLWVVGGGPYRHFVMGLPPALWGQRLMAWAALLRQQFGLAGVVLGLVGVWKQLERPSVQILSLVATFVLYSLYAIGYNTTDSYVYLLPAYVLSALWIAQGAHYVLSSLAGSQRRWSKPLATMSCLALLALPLVSLRTNLPAVDSSHDYTAYDYGTQVFDYVPNRSIVISASDAHTFTLWYFAQVVRAEKALAIIDRDLLGYDWYARGLLQSHAWLNLGSTPQGNPATVEALLEANRDKHAIYLTDADPNLMSRFDFEQHGALYRLRTP